MNELVDYLVGALEDDEAFELGLLSGRGDQREVEWLTAFVEVFRRSLRRGNIAFVIDRAELEALQATARSVVVVDMDPEAVARFPSDVQADVVVMRCPVNLAGVRRLDVVNIAPGGAALSRIEDVPFAPDTRELLLACSQEAIVDSFQDMMAAAGVDLTQPGSVRLVAVDEGGERVLAEFRSMAG